MFWIQSNVNRMRRNFEQYFSWQYFENQQNQLKTYNCFAASFCLFTSVVEASISKHLALAILYHGKGFKGLEKIVPSNSYICVSYDRRIPKQHSRDVVQIIYAEESSSNTFWGFLWTTKYVIQWKWLYIQNATNISLE